MSSNLVLWDPYKAGQVGNLKGQMTGYVAGLYSVPGMANIAAAPTEVLNQNGYNIYQNTNTGYYELQHDNYPTNDSIWTSQSLGVTLDCTGDTLVLKGMNEAEEGQGGNGSKTSQGNGAGAAPFSLVTASNIDYGYYGNNARSSFAASASNALNRLNAAQASGVSYASTYGIDTDETIDPVTKAVVDKEKSAAIDELTMSEATKYKFDNIAKQINKVAEKQNEAVAEAKDHSGGAALGCAAAGAGIGFCVAGPVGAAVGGVIGGIAGFFGGKGVKAYDESKAEKVNKEAAKDAQKVGEELKASLEGLSDEELIAFQRYYQQQTGVKLTDVLKGLETDEDSTEIAQGAGFDSGYLTDMFADIDNANDILKPDDTDADAEVAATNTTQISYSQAAQIEVLQQNAGLYRQYWQAALQNGGSIDVNGKTMTADELSKMYIDANRQLEEYLNGIKSKTDFEA